MMIRSKILVITALLVISSFLVLLIFWLLLQKNISDIMASRHSESRDVISRVIALEGRSMQGLAFDYTYWNEMVDYVQSGDEEWARQNLDTALDSFHVGACWVLKDDFALTGYREIADFKADAESLSADVFQEVFRNSKFPHWFEQINGILFEFRGAPVQPSADKERIARPQGYFVLARAWDAAHLDSLKELFPDSELGLIYEQEAPRYSKKTCRPPACADHILALSGRSGQDAYLHVHVCSPYLIKLMQINNFVMVVVSLTLLLLLIYFVVSISFWISVPISIMSKALQQRDPGLIENLVPQNNELGSLAALIKNFFAQQVTLEREAALRKNLQEKQERQNTVLRMWGRCNFVIATCYDKKVMLERICRIIVEATSYRTAWIGEVQWKDQDAILSISGRYGDDGGYLDAVKDDFVRNPMSSSCVAGQAIRTRAVSVCRTLDEANPKCERWKHEALKRGIRSAVCFPICKKDSVFAVLTIMSDKPSDFDIEERRVIAEVAENLGAGILLRESEQARREAEVKADELAEQLMKTQKLQAVGRLAGGIAHDFNNLLFVIMGNLELVLADERNEETGKELREAMNACREASSLTKQLLALGRRKPEVADSVHVNDEIEKALELMKSALKENVDVRLYLDTDIGLVKGDPAQLMQVFMNLALNSSQAMPSGGEFRVVTESVYVDGNFAPDAIPGNYVLITVSDTGVGMDESVLTHIFEPFFTTKEEGSGLGLALVSSIVTQHGGFIRVSSTKGEGSTFRVFLPEERSVAGPVDSLSEKRPSKSKRGAGETVLLIEDRDMCRLLTKTMLETLGYKVMEAASFSDVMNMLPEIEQSVDLVLSDVVMPGMSGPEIIQKLKKKGFKAKVVYMSGYPDDVLTEHGLPESAVGLLTKPFMLDQLAKAVRDGFA